MESRVLVLKGRLALAGSVITEKRADPLPSGRDTTRTSGRRRGYVFGGAQAADGAPRWRDRPREAPGCAPVRGGRRGEPLGPQRLLGHDATRPCCPAGTKGAAVGRGGLAHAVRVRGHAAHKGVELFVSTEPSEHRNQKDWRQNACDQLVTCTFDRPTAGACAASNKAKECVR